MFLGHQSVEAQEQAARPTQHAAKETYPPVDPNTSHRQPYSDRVQNKKGDSDYEEASSPSRRTASRGHGRQNEGEDLYG